MNRIGPQVQDREQRQARYVEWREVWSASDREWAHERSICRCAHPVRGSRYLGRTLCVRCQRWTP